MTADFDLFRTAMRELIIMFSSADMDDTWRSLNCTEVEMLADVLELGGELVGDPVGGRHAARMVVGQHALHDEPDDQHYYPPGQRVQYTGLGVLYGRTGTVVEGNDGVGIVSVDFGRDGAEPVHVIDLERREDT